MDPPDWNWADFNGARLLPRSGGMATASTRFSPRTCARAIGRAGGGDHAPRRGAGLYQHLGDGRAGDAGGGRADARREAARLWPQAVDRPADYTRQQGGFNEYNSPTYTMVALEEVEAILSFVRDAEARTAAGELHRIIWEMIAGHWHPGTNQWAGPHS